MIETQKRRDVISIVEKNSILIITEDEIEKNENINVLNVKNNPKNLKEVNTEAREQYGYIFFTNECDCTDELINFLPIFSIENCYNKLFVNELLVNPIIMENIEKIVDSANTIELAIMLKHILKNNIKKDDFDFEKEVEYLKKFYQCTDSYIKSFKNKIYNDIEQHYSQGVITRKLKYKINKNEIVKTALYKLIDVINDKLKNTNELVFKQFISTIV